MDPVLRNLIRFQDLSLELSRLQAKLEEFPRQAQTIDAEVQAASGSLDAARAALSDHQKERRRLEGELQDFEAKLRKYNDQLMLVKTNDEYRAMQHEIAGVKQKIDGVEEKILALMEDNEAGERRVKDEQKALEEARKEGEARKAAVQGQKRQVEQEAARVSAELEEARAGLGPDVLDLFNRIARGRNGVALARARDERCQECKVRIRPQIFQEIKRNDRLIQCDSCKRILYHLPEAPAAGTAG
ncbi:MAG TPA: C4-type zinc ribbon domain-containing protein [Candidatus Polarisedimenticolia bacterium]|nr:C4-type zinc ribbon domain-containing protein [Candidatus Polarisedimenticolia bacterium]